MRLYIIIGIIYSITILYRVNLDIFTSDTLPNAKPPRKSVVKMINDGNGAISNVGEQLSNLRTSLGGYFSN